MMIGHEEKFNPVFADTSPANPRKRSFRRAALRAGVIFMILLLAVLLFWIFCYENKYEKMVNTYINYIENELAFDPDSLKIVDVEFIEDGWPNATWICAEGWHSALITYYCIDDVYGGEELNTVHFYYDETAGVCMGYSTVYQFESNPRPAEELTDKLHTYKIDLWNPNDPQVISFQKEMAFQLPAEWGDFDEIIYFDDEKIVFTDYGKYFTSEENDWAQIYQYLTPDESSNIQEKTTYTYTFDKKSGLKTSTFSAAKKGDAIFFPVQEPSDAIMKIDLATGELSELCPLVPDTEKAWVYTLQDKLVVLCDYPVSETVKGHDVIIIDQETGNQETILSVSHDHHSGKCICGMDTGIGKIHLLTSNIRVSSAEATGIGVDATLHNDGSSRTSSHSYFIDILEPGGQQIAHEDVSQITNHTIHPFLNGKSPCEIDLDLTFSCSRGFGQVQASCGYDISAAAEEGNPAAASTGFDLYMISPELFDEWINKTKPAIE